MIQPSDLPHYFRIITQLLQEWLSTAAMRFVAKWWGIELGNRCKFVGLASFSRCRGTQIKIGQGSRFLSATRSNRHGLNRPVMISTLTPNAKIDIGEDAGLSGTVICAAESVHIGNRVMLGANTTVTDTDSHPLDFRERHSAHYGLDPTLAVSATRVDPVRIDDDVFVGMHAIVLKGVTIGRGAVVAAGSVVTKDVPAFSIVAGVPARVVGKVDDSASKKLIAG